MRASTTAVHAVSRRAARRSGTSRPLRHRHLAMVARGHRKQRVDPRIDERFGDRTLIGSGGAADVFAATDRASGCRIALKVLRDRPTESNAADRLTRESFILSQLSDLDHRSLPNLIAVGDDPGFQPWIAMNLVEGRCLGDVLGDERTVTAERAAAWLAQLADALDAAHQVGVIHRDIKPDNIMVGEKIVLIDWGIAHSEAGLARVTEVGLVSGTPQYMSPEQAQDQPTGPASDVYSLGIVAYELLSGEVPFAKGSSVSIAVRHVLETPAPLVLGGSPAQQRLAARVMRMLEKDPADRPSMANVREAFAASASELAAALS